MAVPLITLERFAHTAQGTFGTLRVGKLALYTVERPWRHNQASLSCIPEGLYPLRKRVSPVVQRSSGGEFSEGWEVCDVTDRTFIMLHPGNTQLDVEGCIAPGMALGFVNNHWAVVNSRVAFKKLMTALAAEPEWRLHVRRYHPTLNEA